ncbi:mitochondrial import receptor subunit TOM22 [Biomphalaria glabrata]|nr:mitochondrial import receptor subunit TOM22 [Biomphalaria glabrata]
MLQVNTFRQHVITCHTYDLGIQVCSIRREGRPGIRRLKDENRKHGVVWKETRNRLRLSSMQQNVHHCQLTENVLPTAPQGPSLWNAGSLSIILVIFESERAQQHEEQLQQQRQILLGPNAAVSGTGGSNNPLPEIGIVPPVRSSA